MQWIISKISLSNISIILSFNAMILFKMKQTAEKNTLRAVFFAEFLVRYLESIAKERTSDLYGGFIASNGG